MKKTLIILALTLVGVSACPYLSYANGLNEEAKELGLSFEAGADVVTSYLWRGYNIGGLSVQPSFTIDWRGLYFTAWGSIGADTWHFQEFCPEMDLTIGYDNYGFKLDLTHLYYFGGDRYFKNLENPINSYVDSDGELVESTTTMELHAGIDIAEWTEKVPLTIDWHTTMLGYDPALDSDGSFILNKKGNAKRAYSTYIELGYSIYLPLDIALDLKLGFTPWKGMYSDYEEVWTNGHTVGINNIQLRAEREFELNNLYISVWGEAMFNCYGVNKDNVINTFGNASSQKLNACIGVGIYYGNEW